MSSDEANLRPMRVCHVITGLDQGGAEGALFRLVSNSGDPHKHVIISLTGNGTHGKTLVSLGYQVHLLKMANGRVSLQALFDLRRLIKHIKPDVVQTWMYHADLLGGLASKSLGIPVVWSIRQSDNSIKDVGLKTWIVVKACALFSYIVPVRIINCSKRSIILHKRFGYADKFDYVPNGFDVTSADGLFVKRGDHSPPVFGHAARLHPVKGHAEFLSALLSLKKDGQQFRARMAGSGVCLDNPDFSAIVPMPVRESIDAIGPQSDMPAFYAPCDIFVLSSLGEAFPNVVAEAMLSAVPCIVTDVGDAAEIVGNTGWVVPPNNVNALAVAMLQAANLCANERQQRGQAARQRIIDNYGIDKMISRFEQVWQKAMTRSES